MRTATRYLEKKMVVDVDRITDGRYRRVRVDDRTLDIGVFAPEKDDWVDGDASSARAPSTRSTSPRGWVSSGS